MGSLALHISSNTALFICTAAKKRGTRRKKKLPFVTNHIHSFATSAEHFVYFKRVCFNKNENIEQERTVRKNFVKAEISYAWQWLSF